MVESSSPGSSVMEKDVVKVHESEGEFSRSIVSFDVDEASVEDDYEVDPKDEAAQTVQNGRVRDCLWRIEIAVHLRRCASEVERVLLIGDIQVNLELDGGAVVHDVLADKLGLAKVLGDGLQHVLDGGSSVVLDRVHVLDHGAQGVLADQLLDQLDTLIVGGDLGLQVTHVVTQLTRA